MMRIAKSGVAAAMALALVFGGAACSTGGSDDQAAEQGEASDWAAFVDGFIEERFELDPSFAVYQGRHEFDGRLPDWSEEGLEAQRAQLHDALAEALAFEPSRLTERERFERNYVASVIRGELFWLETADIYRSNPAAYRGALSPSVYTTVPYAEPAQRLTAYTEYLTNIPRAVEQIRANLRTPMPETFVDFGVSMAQGYADYYRGDAIREFSSVTDQALLDAHEEAMGPAADAMESLAQWFEEQRETATQDFALGDAVFAQMLSDTEGVDTPLEELERIGRADLQRNQAALADACAEFAPDTDIRGCIDRAAADKPEGGPVQGARNQLAGLKTFIEENDIVTIPSDQEAMVEEAPPYRRTNLAYINIPGPFETNLPSVYYISPPDPSWSEEMQRDYIPGEADLLFVSVHEVWPGHFLNFLHAQRADSMFGRIFVGYAFAEGWAHYTEEMMWDAGLGDEDPEIHIGQLTNALLRNVRYLSAIGLHTQGMTVDQSRQMFLDEAYQSEGSAEQQAARGTYDPAYLNYTLGKLMIMRLREDWTEERGGRDAWREFHDEFLSYGGPPIPLVRQAMMEEEEPQAVF